MRQQTAKVQAVVESGNRNQLRGSGGADGIHQILHSNYLLPVVAVPPYNQNCQSEGRCLPPTCPGIAFAEGAWKTSKIIMGLSLKYAAHAVQNAVTSARGVRYRWKNP